MITQLHGLALRSLLLGILFAPNAFAQTAETAPPPERADQEASDKGFSTWDVQYLYGGNFREPGFDNDITKTTITLENSSGWSWGSSYFFIDYLRSNGDENHATEFYSEWYPSLSIGKVFGQNYIHCPLKDMLITMGFNAGTKSTGASPLVFLPGVTFDLNLPWFQFFSVGTYAYIDDGRINGEDNGSNATTYQITPSWSLPFNLGFLRFRFDGYIDFIGEHGESSSQILTQPTLKLDLGGTFCNKPNKLLAGVEWIYWKNKYGIEDLDQTATQAVVMWVF